MKTILIVEDDQPKLTQILDVINDTEYVVRIAKSINEAIRELDTASYNYILLDMSLPTFNEGPNASSSGRQQEFGGKQILTYMWELEMEASVMLVTQLPGFKSDGVKEVALKDLDNALKSEFPGLYIGFTYFHHSTDAWEIKLKDFLKSL